MEDSRFVLATRLPGGAEWYGGKGKELRVPLFSYQRIVWLCFHGLSGRLAALTDKSELEFGFAEIQFRSLRS